MFNTPPTTVFPVMAQAITELQVEFLTQDLLDRSGSHPIFLSRVEVHGGEAFSNTFFKKLLSPLLTKSDYTLNQLLSTVEDANDKLQRTDVFSKVDITLYSDYVNNVKSESIKNYNRDKPITTKVLIDLLPITLNFAQGVLNYNEEDLLNVKLDYANSNFNGNAECVKIGVDYNPYKPNDKLRSDLRLLSSLNNPSFKALIDLFHLQQNNQSWQPSVTNSSGGLIGVQYHKDGLKLETGLSLVKRSLTSDLEDNASLAGEHLISSIYKKLHFENVKHLSEATKNFPTSGISVDLTNELSSSAKQNTVDETIFVKSNVLLNLYTSFFNNSITFHSAGDFGNIQQLGNQSNAIHIGDKFFLGGIHSFKGFSKNAIALGGGLQYAKFTNTVYAKLPSWVHSPSSKNDSDPLRLYLTNTTGNVSDNLIKERNPATSFGAGLRYFNKWAQFDIGYYVAKRINGDVDGVKDGFHFSLSIGAANTK